MILPYFKSILVSENYYICTCGMILHVVWLSSETVDIIIKNKNNQYLLKHFYPENPNFFTYDANPTPVQQFGNF